MTNTAQSSTKPTFTVKYFEEPELAFAHGGLHIDPKHGIARFGPKSLNDVRRHPSRVRIGFIGTAQTTELAREWIEINSRGVPGDVAHPGFPGCSEDRGFHTKLEFSEGWNEQISRSEFEELLHTRDKKKQFEDCVALLSSKLALISRRDLAPEYVLLALPDELRAKCGALDYTVPSGGRVHRDLRRAFKAAAMQYRIPTQLLDQLTAEFRDPDNPTKIAWNFFTGLYFKAGGMPWGPVGLIPGTCYVGVSFYRHRQEQYRRTPQDAPPESVPLFQRPTATQRDSGTTETKAAEPSRQEAATRYSNGMSIYTQPKTLKEWDQIRTTRRYRHPRMLY